MTKSPALLLGPLAVLAVVVGIGWVVLGVLAFVLHFPPLLWAIIGTVCVLLGIATLVVGYRSSVRVSADALRVPGHRPVAWESVESVRLVPASGGWLPLVEVSRGRSLTALELDGLLARRVEGRLQRQAQTIADAAGRELEIAAAPSRDRVKPSRAA